MKTFFLILLFASSNTFADVYKELGVDGNYHYKSTQVEAPNGYPVSGHGNYQSEPERRLHEYIDAPQPTYDDAYHSVEND